jgi:hypothetical protein
MARVLKLPAAGQSSLILRSLTRAQRHVRSRDLSFSLASTRRLLLFFLFQKLFRASANIKFLAFVSEQRTMGRVDDRGELSVERLLQVSLKTQSEFNVLHKALAAT